MIKRKTSQESLENLELSLLEERNQDIHKIEEDINDVKEIQNDLSRIIHEQEKPLQYIENELDTVLLEQEFSLESLKERSTYEDRKRSLLFIFGAGAAATCILTALAIRPRH